MRRAARIDGNQNDVVKELRMMGCSVAISSVMGKGFPDIAVGYHGRNYMFEIKDPAQPPSKRKLTPDEKNWHEKWRGNVKIILTAQEAMDYMTLDNPPFG